MSADTPAWASDDGYINTVPITEIRNRLGSAHLPDVFLSVALIRITKIWLKNIEQIPAAWFWRVAIARFRSVQIDILFYRHCITRLEPDRAPAG